MRRPCCIARQLERSGRACLDAASLAVEIEESEGWGKYTVYIFKDGSKACCFETFPWNTHSDDPTPIAYQKETSWEFYGPKQRLPEYWR